MPARELVAPCFRRSAVPSAAVSLLLAAAPALGAPPANLSGQGSNAARAAPLLPPFSAHYTAQWKSINVGASDIELRPETPGGTYLYTWTVTARGIFRLAYSDDVVQKSWFSVIAGHVRPDRYRASQGESTASIDFDWRGGRARGQSELKTIDLQLPAGTQDIMSIQIEVMLDLKNGNLPRMFHILDRDEIKDFIYTQEGPARIRTPLGELDTLIVSSRRDGNDRVLRMWFAPSLDYVPVQAERYRNGKLEFALRLRTLTR